MKTLFLKIFLVLLFLLFVPVIVFAQEQFLISVNVEYSINDSGLVTTTHNVTIENLYSEYYAKSYALTLGNIDPENPRAFQASKPLATTKEKNGNETTLRVEFDDTVLGKGNKRNFSVIFEDNSFVTRTGEVWEIAIPRLSNQDSFGEYSVSLLVPQSFGQEAYLSPEPNSKDISGKFTRYGFDKDSISRAGISAGFGEFQVFAFTLKYHLENPIERSAYVEIALPPDTAFQKVYYDAINPKPTNVAKDDDGNWMARFNLNARERIDIDVSGNVQIFSTERKDFAKPSPEVLVENLKPKKYWQSTDPAIVDLALRLKTPQAIYNFVSTTLLYDYTRVRSNVERLGALEILKKPSSAICMEFTDLFVAIARAAGIPAREINGYAYTENPQIEPLSLVADVLHAWPEYWDQARSVWVPVDPTWGNTTGGVDFFNQLDLRHFTFVVHGKDSEKPYPAGSYKLGASPEKDVFVSFGQLPTTRSPKSQIFSEIRNKIPLFPPKVAVRIENTGSTAIYNTNMEVYFDNNKVGQSSISELLPFSKNETVVNIPYSFLSINMPEKVRVVAAGNELTVPTGKTMSILYNLTAILVIILILVFIALVHAKKLKLPKNVFKFRKTTSPEEKHPTNP